MKVSFLRGRGREKEGLKAEVGKGVREKKGREEDGPPVTSHLFFSPSRWT